MAKYTIQFQRTQYAYIDVEADNIDDALDKADEYYDEHFEELDNSFETSTADYDKMVLL